MTELGVTQAELTRRVNATRAARGDRGVSPAAISMAVNAVSDTTKLMPDINRVLGGEQPRPPAPDRAVADELRARILAGIDALDDRQCRIVADVIEGLMRK